MDRWRTSNIIWYYRRQIGENIASISVSRSWRSRSLPRWAGFWAVSRCNSAPSGLTSRAMAARDRVLEGGTSRCQTS